MNLTFDYFNHLEGVDIYLCNPDGTFLYPVMAYEKHVTLRLNDVSEFSCDIYKTVTDSNCKTVPLDAYDYTQVHRQMYVEGLGWFVMSKVEEHDDGTTCYKSVTAESAQTEFKNRGIYSEERVYCLYNTDDPLDTYYDSDKDDGLPSVVGQLYRQLDIQVDLTQGRVTPVTPYSNWTITYISDELYHSTASPGECRTLEEGAQTGYSFMMSTVQEAFSAIFLFDYQFRAIQILTMDEATRESNLLIGFGNLMNNIDVSESTDELVTVLNCEGQDCDISLINPTGTKYICNFDYYKATQSGAPWMSAALTDVIDMWESAVDAQKQTYADLVLELKNLYKSRTDVEARLQYLSLFLTDLKRARDEYVNVKMTNPNADVTFLKGVITCEKLNIAEYPRSYLSTSAFYSNDFTSTTVLKCYKDVLYNNTTKKFELTGGSKTADVTQCFNDGYLYFADDSTMLSYGKLTATAKVNVDTQTAEYTCNGFERYGVYDLVSPSSTHVCWIDIYETYVDLDNDLIDAIDNSVADPLTPGTFDGINEVRRKIGLINETCNLFNWIKGNYSPQVATQMLRELACYWIEGDYTNNNIKILETTKFNEEIELCQQLYEAGEKDLAKKSFPKLSFEISANDLAHNYGFKDQMHELQLGSVISIEKEEGLWYFPALVEMSFDLDHTGEMTLGFANGLKLDEVSFTIADLIGKSASTSKKVEANWGKFSSYANDKEHITRIINDPLNLTYRAATANMNNQEFTIDDTGILGRRRSTTVGDIFEPEQVRMMNNLIIFTDDSWETIKTALGKIHYTEGGLEKAAYGLAAEVLIGNIILGSAMKIQNGDNSVSINNEGITIRDGNDIMFKADINGNVYLDGYITSDELEAYAKSKDGSAAFGYNILPTGFYLGPYNTVTGAIDNPVFSCDANGIAINGYLSEGDAEATYETLTDAATKANKEDGTANSFRYSLQKTGFVMSQYVDGAMAEVFRCDANGLVLNGYLTSGEAESTYETLTDAANKANKQDGTTNSFSYSLLKTGFSMKKFDGSTMVEVFKCDENGLTIKGNGTFSGALEAATGTFNGLLSANGGRFGHPDDGNPGEWENCLFTIGNVQVEQRSGGGVTYWTHAPVFYTTGGINYAGSGGFGSLSNNTVHIGGDGTSISIRETGTYFNYTTSFRPGYVWTSGRPGTYQGATLLYNHGLQFFYTGSTTTNLATENMIHAEMANITIDDSGDVSGFIKVAGDWRFVQNDDVANPFNTYVTFGQGVNVSFKAGGFVSIGSTNNFTADSATTFASNSSLTINGTVTFGGNSTTTFNTNSTIDYKGTVTNTKNTINMVGTVIDCQPSTGTGARNTQLQGDMYINAGGRIFEESGQVVITSDRRNKNSILAIGDVYDSFFDNLLPVSFKYNKDKEERIRLGFIAQDVENALGTSGLSSNKSGFITTYMSEDGERYALSYNDFIALNTYEIQKLRARVAELEALISK